jgi:hypothetical protein
VEHTVQARPVNIAVHQEDLRSSTGERGRQIRRNQRLPLLGRRTGDDQHAGTISPGERQADAQQPERLCLCRQRSGLPEDDTGGVVSISILDLSGQQ